MFQSLFQNLSDYYFPWLQIQNNYFKKKNGIITVIVKLQNVYERFIIISSLLKTVSVHSEADLEGRRQIFYNCIFEG